MTTTPNDRTPNQRRAEIERLVAEINALRPRHVTSVIETGEQRQQRARALEAINELVDPLIAEYDALVATERTRADRLVHMRDRAQEEAATARGGAELALAELRLVQQTRDLLPAVGLVCDGPGCLSAVGVVGVRAVSSDAMTGPCLEIAAAAGWRMGVDGGHLCPVCVTKAKDG
jgi:hypothetical protein